MKLHQLLLRVYGSTNLLVASVLFLVCLLLGYQPRLLLIELSTSFIICAPAVVALHLVVSLARRTGIRAGAAWICLLAVLPPLALLPARYFAPLVPGDTLALAGLALVSGYAGLFFNVFSISKLFNAHHDETLC